MVDRGTSANAEYNVSAPLIRLLHAHTGTFKRMNPNYEMPIIKPEGSAMQDTDEWGNYRPQQPTSTSTTRRKRRRRQRSSQQRSTDNTNVQTFQARNKVPRETVELTVEELMLTPPVVYGFSLADKTWRELSCLLYFGSY